MLLRCRSVLATRDRFQKCQLAIAMAIALLSASLPFAEPVQAQVANPETLWEATMTAGANSNSVGYLSAEIGSLTASATFSLDGTQYEITGIYQNASGRLRLRMADQAVTSHLQALFVDNGYDLYIDQQQFAIEDSTLRSGNSEFWWKTVSQLWQDGDSIDIRIGKDIYPPTIVNGPQLVSVPHSDGYTFHSYIDIQFEFSEPVTVTGDLRLPSR